MFTIENILASLAMGIMAITFFAVIIPMSLERETSRREQVFFNLCDNYGVAMNKWARNNGEKEPCQ